MNNETTDSPQGGAQWQEKSPRSAMVITLFFIIGPFVGFVAAIWLLWGWGASWLDMALLGIFYLIRGFGITAGYHRLFTHEAFKAGRFAKFAFGIAGLSAIQGSIRDWCGRHYRHHQTSDTAEDDHSPYKYGTDWKAIAHGFYHAHVGWIVKASPPKENSCIKRLTSDPDIVFMDKWIILWGVLGMIIPAILGGLIAGTWWAVLTGFLWGGPACVFLVQQVTWGVNSWCHLIGSKNFRTSDESRDSIIWAIPSLGEGWHRFHHAFAYAARNGDKWWKKLLDVSYWLIWGMAAVGLVSEVRIPTREQIDAKRL